MTAAVGDNANVEIIDPVGRVTGFDPVTSSITRQIPLSSHGQDQAADDSGNGHNEGVTRSVNIETPQPGTYRVVVTGQALGSEWVKISSLSQTGTINSYNIQNIITSPGSASAFSINYASTPGTKSQVQLLASVQSTLADIANCLKLDLIDNQGIANSLSQKIQSAQSATGPARNNILKAFEDEVNAQSGKHIVGLAPQVLLQDANSLISQNQ